MAMQHTLTQHASITYQDLEHQGFTQQQIDRLEALANAYPWIEFVDSIEEWHHLVFLKWRYQTGRLER